jgi:uncharacterized protein (DUF1697 family)
MPQYIAFLRGINVGGHRVKMDRLRGLFEELDLVDLSTFIASGNVIFSTESKDRDELRDKIERHLEQELGFAVPTFLRSPDQLAEIIASNPVEDGAVAGAQPSHFVIFLHSAAPKSLRAGLAGLESEMDGFRFSKTEVYWTVQGKLTDSPLFGRGLDRAMRSVQTTMRNMNTLRRIVAKTGARKTT